MEEELPYFKLKIFLGAAPTYEVQAGKTEGEAEDPLQAFMINVHPRKPALLEVLAKLYWAVEHDTSSIILTTDGHKGIIPTPKTQP